MGDFHTTEMGRGRERKRGGEMERERDGGLSHNRERETGTFTQ